MKKLIAYGFDARGRDYKLYDYGADGYTPKTINEYPNENTYRYWCYCSYRIFACSNDRDDIIRTMKYSTEDSRYYGVKGSFTMV